MTDLNIDAISAMDAVEISRRLSGPAEERSAFIHIAAEAGVADAQALYGQLLLDGDGVPRDQQDAVRWFDRAARQGHVMAMNMMGRCYDLGWGVPIDKVRAAQWFKAASDRGLEWGMYNYATALTLGAGVPEDRPEALALFRKAAAMGNAKATNYVGSFYEDGWAVDRDMAEAARLYAVAAEGGDFRGQFNHARMLIEAGDHEAAEHWLAEARKTATPAFAAKARGFLLSATNDRVRQLAKLFA
ncbi:tetratricopeptide repeat protein [Sphingomonas montanisoli]|uniref:Sel1 repeat family protein n=1 Tax=Sphingomonas montanisoli TaxID=2606412 RepID=A0A5D9C6J1_9SPHN|nr:tetratricopeptide repeat protein [Sphingomonas montanisoli]TZG27143.1 sel1 repeat family protein [Sphingomonas montanisoli]